MRASAAIWIWAVVAAGADATEPPLAVVTHADVTQAEIRFDRALAEHPPGEKMPQIAAGCDSVSAGLFVGLFADGIRYYNRLAERLAGVDPLPPELEAAYSLKVRVEPAVSAPDRSAPPVLSCASFYDLDFAGPEIVLPLRIAGADGRAIWDGAARIPATGARRASLSAPILEGKPLPAAGVYKVEIVPPGAPPILAELWRVAPRSMDALREENAARLAKLPAPAGEALREAAAIARERNAMLADRPSEYRDEEFFGDPIALAGEIQEEIAALERGADPYASKTGDYWRPIRPGLGEQGARVYVPAGVAGAAAPLVIALHGSGGDENVFFDSFGQGLIKRLAEEKGFIVVAPKTKGLDFAGLVESVARHNHIDPARVYVFGHSMGGDQAALLARERPDLVAAVACVGGGSGFFLAGKMAPALVIVAENDGLNSPAKIQAQARKGIDRGLPIELKVVPATGHSITVSSQMPAAIDWLLARRRP